MWLWCILQHVDYCWTLSSFNKNVDTFQSLEISLERRAFGYITHPSSDRIYTSVWRRVRDVPESSPLKRNFKTLKGIYIFIWCILWLADTCAVSWPYSTVVPATAGPLGERPPALAGHFCSVPTTVFAVLMSLYPVATCHEGSLSLRTGGGRSWQVLLYCAMKHTISDSVFFCWIHFNSFDNNACNVSFCHQLKRTETRESRLRSQLQQSSTRVEEQNERFTTLDTQVLTMRQLCDRHEADAKEATSQHLKAKVIIIISFKIH